MPTMWLSDMQSKCIAAALLRQLSIIFWEGWGATIPFSFVSDYFVVSPAVRAWSIALEKPSDWSHDYRPGAGLVLEYLFIC